MRGRRPGEGNVILLVVMLLPVFALFLTLGIDVSHAHSLGVMQKQSLDDACEEVQMRQEEVKFSARPDRTVRDLVASSLERDGYVGRIFISYLERTARRASGSHDNDERHMVVEVAAGRGAGSFFGMQRLWPVTDSVVWTMRAYATYEVFRPPVVPKGDGQTFGRRFEVTFEAGEDGRSVARFGQEESLALADLSDGAVSELERLRREPS